MPDLEAWAVFAKVAETGSLARAAADLDISKPTVSKAIARLERRIGLPLLHRTSRRLSLTEAGRRAADRATQILAVGEAVEAEAMSQASEPRGLVRLSVPMSFGIAHVAPLLPVLAAAHPDITLDLHLSDEVVDLVSGRFDLALRIAALPDSSLRSRRICSVRRLLVGAPAYFQMHGRPQHPRDLVQHACLSYAYLASAERWHFMNDTGDEASVVPQGPLRANNADAFHPMLMAGLGIAVQPEFLVFDDLASGRLEAAMTSWTMPEIALNVVTPPGRSRPARVSAVIDFLALSLSRAAWARIGVGRHDVAK